MQAALDLRADFAELDRLTAWVDAQVPAFGLDDHAAYALRLCIEELVGNVLLHSGAKALRVGLTAPPLTLAVEDDGRAFDPRGIAEPALPQSLEEAGVGGLGLMLTRRYSQGMDVAREGGWNRLTVTL